jgi:pimeloyl-ACP methyl ester carboxylesterase
MQTHLLRDTDTISVGDAQLVFKAGDVADLPPPPPAARTGSPRRPVIVIPGFLGSNLYREGEKIWPNIRELFKLPDLIQYTAGEASRVVAKGLVDEVVFIPNLIRQQKYGLLVSYLEQELGYERERDLWEFAYDFREALSATAERLARLIEEWNIVGPVTILAHSMGTLVSRYYVNVLGGERKVDRLILLGGPHAGSPLAVLNLGMKGTVLPFGLLGSRVQEMLLSFPSMYHLLPEKPCGHDQHGRAIDWLNDASWLAPRYHGMLHEARAFRRCIAERSPVSTLCIFGYGMKTMTSVRVVRDEDGLCSKIEPVFEIAGDGTVPEAMARLDGVDIHPVQQYHGTLHTDQDVRKRLKIELLR